MGAKLGTIKGKVCWDNKDKTIAREARVYAVSGETHKVTQVDENGEFVFENLSPENPWTLFPMHYDGESVKSISKDFKVPQEPKEPEADADSVATADAADDPAARQNNGPEDKQGADPEPVDQSMTQVVDLFLKRTKDINAPLLGSATVLAFVVIAFLLLSFYWNAHQQGDTYTNRNNVIATLQNSQNLVEQIQAGNVTEFKKFSDDLNNLLNQINSGRHFMEIEKEVNIRDALKSLQARLEDNIPSVEMAEGIAETSPIPADDVVPAQDTGTSNSTATGATNDAATTQSAAASDGQRVADDEEDAVAEGDAAGNEPAEKATEAGTGSEAESTAKAPLKEEVAKLRGMIETMEVPYLWTAWPWLLVELWCWGLLGVLVQKVVRLSWYLRIKRYYAEGTLMHWAQVLTTPFLAVIGTMLISVVQIKTGGGGTIGLTSVQAMVIASFLLSLNPWGLWDFLIAKGKGLMDGN